MSRRIEITVPNSWVPPVKKVLTDVDKCNFATGSGKPCMLVELPGTENTVFLITVPGPAVSATLEMFRKNGIGTNIGRVILSSLDYMKPDLSKPLVLDDKEAKKKSGPALKGFQHFQKARKTTEEMYNDISNGANMNINVWMNLMGASIMAGGGLTSGVLVFTVAAMLVSPIMGPILGMVMGYRVADWNLFKTGFVNEMKMAFVAWLIGCTFGVVLGDVGKTYKWPNNQMMPEGQGFNLIISIIVSAAAGTVLGVSLTSTGGNALVGTAISAGLLPPLVNAGMMMAYATVWAAKDKRAQFYELGNYNVLFYFTHVITIVIVANLIFWLKDIQPKFREGEDSNFDDIPILVEHRQRFAEMGKEFDEKAKANFFIEHIKQDLKKDFEKFTIGIKEKADDMKTILTTGKIPVPGKQPRRKSQTNHDHMDYDEEQGEGAVENPLVGGSGNYRRGSKTGGYHGVSTIEEEDAGEHDVEAGRVSYGGDIELTRANTLTSTSPSTKELSLAPSIAPPRPVAKAAAPQHSTREKIVEFYTQYNPSKLGQIDEILAKYQGKEEELLKKLSKQYNISN